MNEKPQFDFEIPAAYDTLLNRGLISFGDSSPLRPWYYLSQERVIEMQKEWPAVGFANRLVAFARRDDSDDVACFEVVAGRVAGVRLVHAWTPEGYKPLDLYESFWDWVRAVVDDVVEQETF